MALPLSPGLTPPEIAFICEMELVTIIPRQRLERLELLGGPLKPLNPPQRASIPLWLALLLKRQRRANIIPPPWLSPDSLAAILKFETESSPDAFSPPPRLPPLPSGAAIQLSSPFLPSSTADAPADALPYHWLELGSILLEVAPDDFDDANDVRKLLRGLREARMAKLRQGVEVLDAGGGFKMNGVGGMELGEARSFITGVVDGLRKIGKSREEARRERERENGYSPSQDYEDDEMDMR